MVLGLILAAVPSTWTLDYNSDSNHPTASGHWSGRISFPLTALCNTRYGDLKVWLTSSPVMWSVDFGHDLGLAQPSLLVLLVEIIDDDIRVVSHHGFKNTFQSAKYCLKNAHDNSQWQLGISMGVCCDWTWVSPFHLEKRMMWRSIDLKVEINSDKFASSWSVHYKCSASWWKMKSFTVKRPSRILALVFMFNKHKESLSCQCQ